MQKNRGKTILGKGSFSILRLYAPLEPNLDTT